MSRSIFDPLVPAGAYDAFYADGAARSAGQRSVAAVGRGAARAVHRARGAAAARRRRVDVAAVGLGAVDAQAAGGADRLRALGGGAADAVGPRARDAAGVRLRRVRVAVLHADVPDAGRDRVRGGGRVADAGRVAAAPAPEPGARPRGVGAAEDHVPAGRRAGAAAVAADVGPFGAAGAGRAAAAAARVRGAGDRVGVPDPRAAVPDVRRRSPAGSVPGWSSEFDLWAARGAGAGGRGGALAVPGGAGDAVRASVGGPLPAAVRDAGGGLRSRAAGADGDRRVLDGAGQAVVPGQPDCGFSRRSSSRVRGRL